MIIGSTEQQTDALPSSRESSETSRHVASDSESNWSDGAETMKRKYSLAIEGEPGSYSAHVPELPTIVVTGRSMEELTVRAREAIRLYWEAIRGDLSPTSTLREIEVDLPA